MHKSKGRYTKTGWPRYRYACHKSAAKRRGILFEFSFEEWLKWWEDHLGPNWMDLRGCKPNQYHMARYGDRGAYRADNVKCITALENRKEGGQKNRGEASGRAAKLTTKQMLAVRMARGLQRDIAKRFGISQSSVSVIQNHKRWKHI